MLCLILKSSCQKSLLGRSQYYHVFSRPIQAVQQQSQKITANSNNCRSCWNNFSTLSKFSLGSNNCSSTSIVRSKIQNLINVQSRNVRLSKIKLQGMAKSDSSLSRTDPEAAAKNIKISRSTKKEFARLLGIAKDEKWPLTGAILLLLISSGVTMSIPFCLGKVIDLIYTGNSETTKKNLETVCLALLGIFVVGALCNFGRTYLMSIAGQKITNRMRTTVFSSILKQDIAFFDKNKTGELINRLSADTSLVSQSVTMNISDGLRSLFLVGAGVSMMFYTSTELAFVGLGVVPPVACIAIFYGRYVRTITKKVQDSLAGATQVAEERIANIRTVRAFTQEEMENRNYQEKIRHVLDLSYKEALARGIFFGITGLSANFIILTVLYYGGTMVSTNSITVGSLSAFLLYAAYVGIAMGGLSSFYSEMMKGLGASTRIWELIDRKPTIPLTGGYIPAQIVGHIKLTNLSFHYPTRIDVPIFQDINLDIPEGSVLALVGPSGCGKSTLGALLLRFYDPTGGSISIDGKNIAEWDPQTLRKQIGLVNQEPILFSSSIKDNILYGAPNPEKIDDEEIFRVAKEANAYDFIMRFPQKFDTLVGERGIMVSGGQRQRIAIARALIKNPKILLFDEATSALDAESEYLVQQALERASQNRTVITIAHRLSTIRNSDKIAILNQGQIAEAGTYEQLMSINNGFFRKLVDKQTIQQ